MDNAERYRVHTESMGCLLMHPTMCLGTSQLQEWCPSCACWIFAVLRTVPRHPTWSLCQEPISEGGHVLRVTELLRDFIFPQSCSGISFFKKSKTQDIDF